MNWGIIILCGLILILDIYILILDRKVRKLQDAIKGIKECNNEMVEYSKKLANITLETNSTVDKLVKINNDLSTSNVKIVTEVKKIIEYIGGK